jgi:outer membrane immunogenic protein
MKLLSGIFGLVLTCMVTLASGNAADMYGYGGYKGGPAYAEVNWSGFYAGVNAGYGSSGRTDYLDPTGGFGGGQMGYNWQSGHFVFGLETDFQGAGISDSNFFDKSTMNWFGTVRGRLGYAFDRTLVYATGGFAYGQVENDGFHEAQTGYVLGGGVEYKFRPDWSVKVEYQYLNLDAPLSSPVGPLGYGFGETTKVHTVRVGLNYHFGGGYEILK